MGKTHPACSTCGSADVVKDAWAEWDSEKRDWVLSSVYDHAQCNTCEGETRLVWKDGEPVKADTRIVVGAFVEYRDPDDGVSDGTYRVEAINGEGDEDDIVLLTDPSGDSELEAHRHELKFVTPSKCDECGNECGEIMGCPDGREVCRDCFDNGVG